MECLASVLFAFKEKILQKVRTLNAQNLCNTAWAITVAGHLDDGSNGMGGLAEALMYEAVRRNVGDFTDSNLCQLRQLLREMKCMGYKRYAEVENLMIHRNSVLHSATSTAWERGLESSKESFT